LLWTQTAAPPFFDRQRIHIGAARDGTTRLRALQDAHHASAPHTGPDFQAEVAQMLFDQARGPILLAEFRVLTNISSPGDEFTFNGRGPFSDFQLKGGLVAADARVALARASMIAKGFVWWA
jgi:hypothetical protein